MTSPPVPDPKRPPSLPSLLALTSGRVAPGIWRVGTIPTDAVEQANDVGWQPLELDLSQPLDKQSLLTRLADAASFPDYFGHNWDAASDCLQDLEWLPAPGYLLSIHGAEQFRHRHHDLDAVLVDVLLETIDYWTAEGVPFHVLWENPNPTSQHPDRFNFVPGPRTDIASVSPWPTPNT